MKENTVFHCGNESVKYSCFRGKDRKHYLRQTFAGSSQYRLRRIKKVQVDEFFQMQNLEAKLDWCAQMMAEEVRNYVLPYTPQTEHPHTEADNA